MPSLLDNIDITRIQQRFLTAMVEEGVLTETDFATGGAFAPPRLAGLLKAAQDAIALRAGIEDVEPHAVQDSILHNMLQRANPGLAKEAMQARLDDMVGEAITEKYTPPAISPAAKGWAEREAAQGKKARQR